MTNLSHAPLSNITPERNDHQLFDNKKLARIVKYILLEVNKMAYPMGILKIHTYNPNKDRHTPIECGKKLGLT